MTERSDRGPEARRELFGGIDATGVSRGHVIHLYNNDADGLTILRAIAKHHHGRHGFLTEGVDWNNHVGKQHHFDEAEYGDIKYTEPLLNNLHIVEPTLLVIKLKHGGA